MDEGAGGAAEVEERGDCVVRESDIAEVKEGLGERISGATRVHLEEAHALQTEESVTPVEGEHGVVKEVRQRGATKVQEVDV